MLQDVRVVDLSTEIAGPYCTKLLADAGADVVKVEPPGGDPLRRWGDGKLFRFLNTSKRSVVADMAGDRLAGEVRDLVAGADLVVESMPAGAVEALRLHDVNPGVVVVSISPYGHEGPWRDRPATEFTLQAVCGSTGVRGVPERTPLAAGGRLGEFVGGTYAAVAALAAARAASRDGLGDHVDVSILETMTVSMNTYTSVFSSFAGWPDVTGPSRSIEIPSIEPTSDGYVGFCTITAQQFNDFLALIERPDLIDDRDLATAAGRSRRMHEVLGIIHAWTRERTSEEIIELASLLRIPVAPVGNGATVLEMEHFRERGVFVEHPGGGFRQPRVPYRIHGLDTRAFTPAPELGEHTGTVAWTPRAASGAGPAAGARPLPLDGVRVLDFTAFWAGPAATAMLAALGADVIKIEAVQRPDGMRFTTTKPPTVDSWWDWGPIWQAANAGKRGVTLDLTREEGVDLARRLIATADAVVENFTPRVMEQFGLGWNEVHAANPAAVMVRISGFGLDGPWRDRTGFAQTMEQVSGLAWVTGYDDGPPLIPRGACDPLAGMHAVVALLAALEDRDRTGGGRLVEVAMVEAALNAAAEQVIEYTANGRVLERHGNRGPGAAPQGVYACRGDEQWLALSVADDAQWAGLREALGDPEWARDPALADHAGRQKAHDRIDEELARWCATQDPGAAADLLAGRGVPAETVIPPRDVILNPQVQARGFVEEIDHPVTGAHPFPGVPFRFASHAGRWIRSPAPTIGQHNDEILGGLLGLDAAALASLRDSAVIGERPKGV